MDPQNQNDQVTQEKQPGGFTNDALSIANNISGLRNLPVRSGSRVAVQAGKLAAQAAAKGAMALFTTPAGWVILTVTIITIVTFVIVFSLGAPPMNPNSQTSNQTQQF